MAPGTRFLTFPWISSRSKRPSDPLDPILVARGALERTLKDGAEKVGAGVAASRLLGLPGALGARSGGLLLFSRLIPTDGGTNSN